MDTLQRALHLGRTVNFDCIITLDQLINVPLLNGKFKLKWKFAHPITSVHIEAQMKAKQVATTISHRLTMSDDENHLASSPPPLTRRPTLSLSQHLHSSSFNNPTPQTAQTQHGFLHQIHQASPSQSTPLGSSTHRYSQSSLMAGRRRSLTDSTCIPNPYSSSLDHQNRHRTELGLRDHSHMPPQLNQDRHRKSSGSSSIAAHKTPTLNHPTSGSDDGYKYSMATPRLGYDPSLGSHTIEPPVKAESSGSTAYVQVRNHVAVFRQAFHCPISVLLDKEGKLEPSLLTMIIKQEHVGEDGRREVTRHGSVSIDLSRFTPMMSSNFKPHGPFSHLDAEGQRTRIEKGKFLLQDCKTNASLKLQIQMDYISGITSFKTPTSPSPLAESLYQIISPADDSKSISSRRKSSTGSPDSSIISSNSSGKTGSGLVKKVQVSPSAYTHGSHSLSNINPRARSSRTHPNETSLQAADELIDVLFSNSYIPSSGPITQRLQGFKARNEKSASRPSAKALNLGVQSNELPKNSAHSKPSTLDVWENSSFLQPREHDDDSASRRSAKSMHSKFRSFARTRMAALHAT